MSRKSKGINAERNLVHKFWEKGWACIRVAGSGSSSYPSPDILVGNKTRKLAIECKTSGDSSRYLAKEDVEQLKIFSTIFGAEPWIAVRFDREDWFFLNIEDLEKTENNYVVTINTAKKKGLIIEEIIK